MSKAGNRILALVASSLVGLVLAAFIWKLRPASDTVELLDNSEAIARLLRERQTQDGSAPALRDELLRETLSEERAMALCGELRKSKGRTIYDRQTISWERPNYDSRRRFKEHPRGSWQVELNDMGFRKAVDVRRTKPDLRILVAGDSHTAGIVPSEEQFANLLESKLAVLAPELTIEGLNGGKGGFHFYNYVGTLEKFLHLEPDVFVMTVFGGNDFAGSVSTFRYFNRMAPSSAPPKAERQLLQELGEKASGLVAQDLNQLVLFRWQPESAKIAATAARQALTTIDGICREQGIEFLVVYIPPCSDVQPEHIKKRIDNAVRLFDLTPDELAITSRLADGFLAFAEASEIRCIDMRPIFETSEEPCYWLSDLHINTLGHRLIADELQKALRPRLER